MKTWSSRKLQIVAFAALALCTLVRVFWVPFTKQGRAEKLYEDSWFIRDRHTVQEAAQSRRVEAMEYVLDLYPGNSRYEQALVWNCQIRNLPDILRNRKLGLKAHRLAIARLSEKAISDFIYENPLSRSYSRKLEALKLTDELVKVDPGNSLAHYRKSICLFYLGRNDSALAELRIANRLGPPKRYLPDVSPRIVNSLWCYSSFSDRSEFGSFSDKLIEEAPTRLRHGDVAGARSILEECSRMSVNISLIEPPILFPIYTATSIQSQCEKALMPIYKDFSMRENVKQFRILHTAFAKARAEIRKEYESNNWIRRIAIPHIMPLVLVYSAIMALLFMIILALVYLLPAIMQKRHKQNTVDALPWVGSFLMRILCIGYVVLIVGSFAVVCKWPILVFFQYGMPESYSYCPTIFLASAVMNLVIVLLLIRVLHHQYDVWAGLRIGIFRFMFLTPANVKVWTRKHLVAAFGTQMLFILCLAMLTTIIYKPLFGGHPWETQRFRISNITQDQATARKLADEIKKAYYASQSATETNPAQRPSNKMK